MSEELWHVQIEPGDVKTVTLEQMDDMYRLDLIQASTLVWQRGMSKALPLSVVAGIEDDGDDDVMEIEPEVIPEKARPPAPPRQATITPPPTALSAAVRVTAPPAPRLPTPDFYSPASLRPITMTDSPSFRRAPSAAGGRVLIGIAVALGILLTLHRNDLLRPVAASAGQEAMYQRLESALGSPDFGTVRSVAAFSATLNPATEADLASESAALTAISGTQSSIAADTLPTGSKDRDSEALAGAPTPNSSPANASKSDASLGPQRSSNKQKAPSSGKKAKSQRSSEYDPMNAKL